MSVAQAVLSRVKRMPKGRPFARVLLAPLGSRASVGKALSRLVQYTGKNVCPSPLAVMKVVTRMRGETIQIHGAEAARRLGLSTQMQVLPIFYTSGFTREFKIGNAVVRLQHVPKDRLQQAGTKVGVALTALHYIGKEGLSPKVIFKIVSTLSNEELMKLKACKMPEWMRMALSEAVKGVE